MEYRSKFVLRELTQLLCEQACMTAAFTSKQLDLLTEATYAYGQVCSSFDIEIDYSEHISSSLRTFHKNTQSDDTSQDCFIICD